MPSLKEPSPLKQFPFLLCKISRTLYGCHNHGGGRLVMSHIEVFFWIMEMVFWLWHTSHEVFCAVEMWHEHAQSKPVAGECGTPWLRISHSLSASKSIYKQNVGLFVLFPCQLPLSMSVGRHPSWATVLPFLLTITLNLSQWYSNTVDFLGHPRHTK